MTNAAWKDFERRWCRIFGGERRPSVGPRGWAHGSDDDGSAVFAIECKRSKRRVPEGRWIDQARANGKTDGRDWLLIVGGHNDRTPIAVLDAWTLADICRLAGMIE